MYKDESFFVQNTNSPSLLKTLYLFVTFYTFPTYNDAHPSSTKGQAARAEREASAMDIPTKKPPTPAEINKFLERYDHYPETNKSHIQKLINGEKGPAPMIGVIKYPYSTFQRVYGEDFRAMVSRDITHPFINSAMPGAGSMPHNLLSGHNFDDNQSNLLISESMREYTKKDLVAHKNTLATGVRSECTQFLG